MTTSTTPIRFDADWLCDVGLSELPPPLASEFLTATYEHLEARVGVSIAAKMTDDELVVFEALIDDEDETRAFHWLEEHVPGHREIVRDEFVLLTNEVREHAPTLLAAVARAAAEVLR